MPRCPGLAVCLSRPSTHQWQDAFPAILAEKGVYVPFRACCEEGSNANTAALVLQAGC